VSRRSSVPNLVRIGRTVRESFRFLQISTWRPAAILDYAFRHSWDHRLVSGTKRMINTKFGAYRMNRFEDIQFLVNSQFFVGGHLGFCKMAVLTLPVSRLCHVEAPCQIWWESDERFESYSSFCKFQYGGRRPCWIINFDILGPQACSGCEADDTYQIWCIYDEPFRSYPIFSKFQFFVGGHLGFWKITVLSPTLSVWHQGEAPHQIWWESVQRFWSYSTFRKFQNCGAAILDSVIFKFLAYFLI